MIIRYFIHGLLLFLCVACSPRSIEKECPHINELPANSKFRIILPEDHTTGYTWQLSQDYDRNAIAQINEVWHGNEKGIYFNLSALAAGQTTLTFISRKYTDTADIKCFIVKIIGE